MGSERNSGLQCLVKKGEQKLGYGMRKVYMFCVQRACFGGMRVSCVRESFTEVTSEGTEWGCMEMDGPFE